VGDLAVYYEIDSFLPIRPQFEFLRKSSFKRMGSTEGFRLKTIRLRGQISQGLLTPIPEGINNPKEGDDLTEVLDIVKYEPPIPAQLAGKIKGKFPSFIPKTDEIRIQNFESEVGFNPVGERAYVTEKLDGTSFTCYFNNGVFGVCGRNWELSETDDNSLWRIAKMLDLKEKMSKHGKNIALQGELLSPGVQGNLYNFKYINVYFFTAYDIDNRRRMSFDELEWVLFKLDLNMVPVLEFNYNLPIENLVEYMLKYAEGKSVLNPDVEREGIVVRGLNKEFSFKAISNKFLLSENN
jgi:RNA ligase (TIGR02306 family)